MDYFSIIKRLGLFQSPSNNSKTIRSLPPVSAKSIKISQSSKLLNIKPSLYSCLSPTPKKNPESVRKSSEIKFEKTGLPKLKFISHENSPRYSAASRNGYRRNIKPQAVVLKKKPECELDDFSGISAWSKTSSYMNSGL